jgi:flagellar hook-associated protein 3 FlgL
MKASFVSSSAISSALRYQLMRMQSDLVKAQEEVATGRVADPGLALGARTGQSVSISRDIERLNGIKDSNAVASTRLSVTQDALDNLKSITEDFLGTLFASKSGNLEPSITLSEAQSKLYTLTTILNTSLNGEYTFAGINTDVKPLNDFNEAGSLNRVAFDTSFDDYFTFAQDDLDAADITGAEMEDFLTTVVESQFMGTGWQTSWSNATDQQIVSRISLNETAETSVSANNDGARKLAMATATISALFTEQMSDEAKAAIVDWAIGVVGEAFADLGNEQSKVGIAENRVSRANDRIESQIGLLELNLSDLEGIDYYEAATRITALETQIGISYELTARLQKLSLLNFLT